MAFERKPQKAVPSGKRAKARGKVHKKEGKKNVHVTKKPPRTPLDEEITARLKAQLEHDFFNKPSRHGIISDSVKTNTSYQSEAVHDRPALAHSSLDGPYYYPGHAVQAKAIALGYHLSAPETSKILKNQETEASVQYTAWRNLFASAGLDTRTACILTNHTSGIFAPHNEESLHPHAIANNSRSSKLPVESTMDTSSCTAASKEDSIEVANSLKLQNSLKEFDIDAVDTILVIKMVSCGVRSVLDQISLCKADKLASNVAFQEKLPMVHQHFHAICNAFSEFATILQGTRLSSIEIQELFLVEHGVKHFDISRVNLDRAVELLVEDEALGSSIPNLETLLSNAVREALSRKKAENPGLSVAIDQLIARYLDVDRMEVDDFDQEEAQLWIRKHLKTAHRIERTFFKLKDLAEKGKLAEEVKMCLDAAKVEKSKLQAHGRTYGLTFSWLARNSSDGKCREVWWARFYTDEVSPVDPIPIDFTTDSESEGTCNVISLRSNNTILRKLRRWQSQ